MVVGCWPTEACELSIRVGSTGGHAPKVYPRVLRNDCFVHDLNLPADYNQNIRLGVDSKL